MNLRQIKAGTADNSVVIRIIDATSRLPEQAVEHDTAGIDLWYRREGGLRVAITEAALAALDTAHTDGGIEHIDDGYYRLDLPDAACAVGAEGVMVGGAVTDMIVEGCYIDLTTYEEIAAAVWDEILTGATHNIPTSAGRRLREASDTAILRGEETAQAGSASTITLAAGASIIDGFYNTSIVIIIEGAGVGQARTIKSYVGSSRVATMCMDWGTTPDNTSKYVIRGMACVAVYAMHTAVIDLINADWTDGGRLDLIIDAIKAKTDNLPEGIQKNQAFEIDVLMIDSTDHLTPKIGLTVACTRTIDGGAFGAFAGSIVEVSAGMYHVSGLAADTNGDAITYRFTATGADDRFITIRTTT